MNLWLCLNKLTLNFEVEQLNVSFLQGQWSEWKCEFLAKQQGLVEQRSKLLEDEHDLEQKSGP